VKAVYSLLTVAEPQSGGRISAVGYRVGIGAVARSGLRMGGRRPGEEGHDIGLAPEVTLSSRPKRFTVRRLNP